MIVQTDQEIRAIVRDEINQNRYQSGTPVILPHQHNGIDSPQVNASNIVPNSKFMISLAITNGTVVENTYTINGVSNPTAMYFYGIGRNPVSGPAVIRASLSGMAQFGLCYHQDSTTDGPIATTILQSSTCFTANDTGPNFAVATDSKIVNLQEHSGGQVGYVTVTGFTKTSITIYANVQSGYLIQGSFIIV